jgi:hypothetical protein
MADLKLEFQHYLDNKKDFLQKYNGKFIVIKDLKVIGVFEDRLKAIEETQKVHTIGSFLVQHVTPNEDDQVRFHSRLAI